MKAVRVNDLYQTVSGVEITDGLEGLQEVGNDEVYLRAEWYWMVDDTIETLKDSLQLVRENVC